MILRGKPNLLSRGAGTGQPSGEGEVSTQHTHEEFIVSGDWRLKHNSLSRGAGADLGSFFLLLGRPPRPKGCCAVIYWTKVYAGYWKD